MVFPQHPFKVVIVNEFLQVGCSAAGYRGKFVPTEQGVPSLIPEFPARFFTSCELSHVI